MGAIPVVALWFFVLVFCFFVVVFFFSLVGGGGGGGLSKQFLTYHEDRSFHSFHV